MIKYQLWSRDEYGQGSILFTSDDIKAVMERAKREITSINVQNALTVSDRDKNWEAYMIMISSGANKKKYVDYLYAGNTPRNKNNVYGIKEDGSVDSLSISNIQDPVVRIYLGDISTKRGEEKDWYATDAKKNIIDRIDHPDLNGKTQFFISKIEA